MIDQHHLVILHLFLSLISLFLFATSYLLSPKTTWKAIHERCGDGVRGRDEDCDDGNSRNGDGCSSDCTVEKDYVCVGGNLTSVAADRCVAGSVISSYTFDNASSLRWDAVTIEQQRFESGFGDMGWDGWLMDGSQDIACSGDGFPSPVRTVVGAQFMERSFNVSTSHNHVHITFPLVWLDYWSSNKYINIYVDGALVQKYFKYNQNTPVFNSQTNGQFSTMQDACYSTSYADDWTVVNLDLYHNQSSLDIKIVSSVGASTTYTWGIANFTLTTSLVPDDFPILNSPLGSKTLENGHAYSRSTSNDTQGLRLFHNNVNLGGIQYSKTGMAYSWMTFPNVANIISRRTRIAYWINLFDVPTVYGGFYVTLILGGPNDLASVTPESCRYIQNHGLKGASTSTTYDGLSIDCSERQFYRICYNSLHDEPYYSNTYNYYCDEYHKTPQREWRLDTLYPYEKFDAKYGIGRWNGTQLGMQFAVRADYYASDRTIEAWVDDIIVSELAEAECDNIVLEANATHASLTVGNVVHKSSDGESGWFIAILNASTHEITYEPRVVDTPELKKLVYDTIKWGQLLTVATVGSITCDVNCSSALVALGGGYYPFDSSDVGSYVLIGRGSAIQAFTMPSAAVDHQDGRALVTSKPGACFSGEESLTENTYMDSVVLDADKDATLSLSDVTTYQFSNYSHGYVGCYRWNNPSYWNNNIRRCVNGYRTSPSTCSQCCAEGGFGFAMVAQRSTCYCGSDLSEYSACDYYDDCGSAKIDDAYCRYSDGNRWNNLYGDNRQQGGRYYRTVSVFNTLGATEMLPGSMEYSCTNAKSSTYCGYVFDGNYGTNYYSSTLCTSRGSCSDEKDASIELTFKGGKQFYVAKFRIVWYDDNSYHPANWHVSYRIDPSSDWVPYFNTTDGLNYATNAYSNYRDGVDGPKFRVNGIRLMFDAYDQSQTQIRIREIGLSIYESEADYGRNAVLRANKYSLSTQIDEPQAYRNQL